MSQILSDSGVVVFGLDITEGKNKNIHSFICDVSDESQVVSVLNRIKEKTYVIDYLVNAAGMLTIGKPLEIIQVPIRQMDAIMRINLMSAFILTKHCHPLLKNSSAGAAIVNISSEQAYKPQRGFAPYSISKAAINALTQSAAREFLADKIRVNALAFGTVKTNILNSYITDDEEIDRIFAYKDEFIPLGIIQPENAAEIVRFLLSDKAKHITGEIIQANSGNCLL